MKDEPDQIRNWVGLAFKVQNGARGEKLDLSKATMYLAAKLEAERKKTAGLSKDVSEIKVELNERLEELTKIRVETNVIKAKLAAYEQSKGTDSGARVSAPSDQERADSIDSSW